MKNNILDRLLETIDKADDQTEKEFWTRSFGAEEIFALIERVKEAKREAEKWLNEWEKIDQAAVQIAGAHMRACEQRDTLQARLRAAEEVVREARRYFTAEGPRRAGDAIQDMRGARLAFEEALRHYDEAVKA